MAGDIAMMYDIFTQIPQVRLTRMQRIRRCVARILRRTAIRLNFAALQIDYCISAPQSGIRYTTPYDEFEHLIRENMKGIGDDIHA